MERTGRVSRSHSVCTLRIQEGRPMRAAFSLLFCFFGFLLCALFSSALLECLLRFLLFLGFGFVLRFHSQSPLTAIVSDFTGSISRGSSRTGCASVLINPVRRLAAAYLSHHQKGREHAAGTEKEYALVPGKIYE